MDERVESLIESLDDPERQADSRRLVDLMSQVTDERAGRWYDRVIGFGRAGYRYASGRTAESGKIGFAPGGREITLYMVSGMVGYDDLLDRLGKHRRAKSCIYVRRLKDVDEQVLKALF